MHDNVYLFHDILSVKHGQALKGLVRYSSQACPQPIFANALKFDRNTAILILSYVVYHSFPTAIAKVKSCDRDCML